MREKDELDVLLDSALSRYGEGHATAGLEGRILERIRNAGEAPRAVPRRRRLLWAIAVPVAACVLFLMVTMKREFRHVPLQEAQSQKTGQVQGNREPQPGRAPAGISGPMLRSATRERKAPVIVAARSAGDAIAKPASLPKLDVFPAPQPLTAEERALYTFATAVPEGQRQAVLEAQKKADAPLDLAAIHIPPLEVPEQGKN
jgi:hypothetical protein